MGRTERRVKVCVAPWERRSSLKKPRKLIKQSAECLSRRSEPASNLFTGVVVARVWGG